MHIWLIIHLLNMRVHKFYAIYFVFSFLTSEVCTTFISSIQTSKQKLGKVKYLTWVHIDTKSMTVKIWTQVSRFQPVKSQPFDLHCQIWHSVVTYGYLNWLKVNKITLCNSMDGSREHYAKGNKPVSERQVPWFHSDEETNEQYKLTKKKEQTHR